MKHSGEYQDIFPDHNKPSQLNRCIRILGGNIFIFEALAFFARTRLADWQDCVKNENIPAGAVDHFIFHQTFHSLIRDVTLFNVQSTYTRIFTKVSLRANGIYACFVFPSQSSICYFIESLQHTMVCFINRGFSIETRVCLLQKVNTCVKMYR